MATPSAASVISTPQERSVSRAEIVDLGRAGKAWSFLPVAARALALAPQDLEIRFLAAANLAQLGLKTLARVQLDALGHALREDPQVRALQAAMAELPPDEIGPGTLVTTCGHNLVALQGRGQCVGLDTNRWTAGLARWRFCRAVDGNIVRAPGNDTDLTRWVGLVEQVAGAKKLVADNVKRDEPFRAPITLEGIDPPWQFMELARATPEGSNGYRTPIIVVQADESEFLDGLSQFEMMDLLAQDRVRFFVGPHASERLGEYLGARLGARINGPLVRLTGVRTPTTPAVAVVLGAANRRQGDEAARLHEAVTARYAGRGPAWWRERYRAALGGSGKPLRVLIPTCRFTTFVVHASHDLARAVERAGHQARVLMEPDACTTMSSVEYRDAVSGFDPDLIVLVNYPRRSMPGAFPDNVPHVAWLQDPMPHLFDPALGKSMGELDFVAGHLFPELFEKFSYPAARALRAPVVACASKFSDEPVPAEQRARHECEIAYVSHQSQTPEELHATLWSQASDAPELRRAFDRLFSVLPSVVRGAKEVPIHIALPALVREHVRLALGKEPDDRTRTVVHRHYALPIAERMFRHEALGWAAQIARSRGWRFHLYGRGWEKHPVFGQVAKGELVHGDGLRASYQAAAAHLHMSLTAVVHQRVLECAMAGGLPLCRMHLDALAALETRAQVGAIAACGEPAVTEASRVGYALADTAEGMALAGQLQRLGMAVEPYVWVPRERLETLRRLAAVYVTPHDETWLLGDLAGTTFWSVETLESLLARAVGRTSWRANVSGGIGRRVRAELTHDALWRRMVAMVASSLGADTRPLIAAHKAA